MYCMMCDSMIEEENLIKDENGYTYPYFQQLCIKCNPCPTQVVPESVIEAFEDNKYYYGKYDE